MTGQKPVRTIGVVLFPRFELLDVFGPLEVFGHLPASFKIVLVAEAPGPVQSEQGPKVVADCGFKDCPHLDLLLVPGGPGIRAQVENRSVREWLKQRAEKAELVTSVCGGSALLARAGILNDRRATSNKIGFEWVTKQGPSVRWVRAARWVDDGNIVTSSGVAAGIDMSLYLIGRLAGAGERDEIARIMEYEWRGDESYDPFASMPAVR